MKIIIPLVLLLILINGCAINDYVKIIEVDTDSECLLGCKELMEEYWCLSSAPSYQFELLNNEFQNNKCKCILMDCVK